MDLHARGSAGKGGNPMLASDSGALGGEEGVHGVRGRVHSAAAHGSAIRGSRIGGGSSVISASDGVGTLGSVVFNAKFVRRAERDMMSGSLVAERGSEAPGDAARRNRLTPQSGSKRRRANLAAVEWKATVGIAREMADEIAASGEGNEAKLALQNGGAYSSGGRRDDAGGSTIFGSQIGGYEGSVIMTAEERGAELSRLSNGFRRACDSHVNALRVRAWYMLQLPQ